MAVRFYTEGHRYESLDIFENIEWTSISKLSGRFKKVFNAPETALKSSQKKSSKWYGIPPNQILEIWQMENLRSTTLGTWYHKKQEDLLLSKTSINHEGHTLPIFPSIIEDGVKYARDQKLVDGVYPEHLCYLKSVGVCGQMDEIIVCDGFVHVNDFKSNKDLKKPAFVNWEGISAKMQPPLLHLEETKLNEYALQLSLGMYIVLRHNPQLKSGKLTLNYVTFETKGEDKYGYPIMALDTNNEPILKTEEKVLVPYLRREVELMFEFLKQSKKVCQ